MLPPGFVTRPLTRSLQAAGRRQGLTPVFPRSTFLYARTSANTNTRRPPSDSFEHAAQNMKEEIGHTAEDLAKIIAGTNSAKGNAGTSFVGITSSIASQVPPSAMAFGLAGTIPYVGAGATTVYLAKQAGMATAGVATGIDPGVALTILDQAMTFQVTYGAVILSFLGAMHWGMEFAEYGGQQGWKRLALGAAPVLIAWPTLALQPTIALIVQWAGFTGMWYADSKATNMGWAPSWFSQYRFYLSILVGTCIIGSLVGTSYYGPVAGHGLLSHDLELIREERRQLVPEKEGVVKGNIQAIVNPKDEDGFIRVSKHEPEQAKESQ